MKNMKMIRKQFGLLVSLIVVGSICVSTALSQGGAATSQSRNTDGKADQNLKSVARVNPSTLAMEMSLPFMSYPGRNGNSLPVGFTYSSKLWRMKPGGTYFYLTPIGHYKQYVTQLWPRFAERSAAGWTSSVAFPTIEEKLDTYDQFGNPFDPGSDINAFNYLFQTASQGSSLINNPNLPCGSACIEQTRWCIETVCTGWECTGWDWNTANCWGGGPVGGNCQYSDGYCPPECSFCTEEPQCPPWNPNCDNPEIPPGSEPTPTLHYVKRVNVRMGDGSVHEFRKSDAVFGHCVGGQNDGPDCEPIDPDKYGMFLAVDGSGIKLHRTMDESTLYLPDGSRFLFRSAEIGHFDNASIYPATDYFDAEGNHSKFEFTTTENQFAANNQPLRKLTDTLGREIYDPLPLNLVDQSQQEGIQPVDLPGFGESGVQHYELTWLHLKPVPCSPDVTTNCGNPNGALENQSENLFFYSAIVCSGGPESRVDPNNNYPNQFLFPANGIGLRSCNPGIIASDAKRFNPVVLAKVLLPNGTNYEFKYNQFGEITKITYPTGSYETFQYSQITPINGFDRSAYDQTNRGVTERKVFSADNTVQQMWKYSANMTGVNGTYKLTTIASKKDNPLADGVKTEKYLIPGTRNLHDYGFEDPSVGMPEEEIVKDENGTIRSRTLTDWITNGPVPTNDPLRPAHSAAKRDPRIKRTISITIENGQALSVLNENEYETPGESGSTAPSDPEYFAHLNVKRTKSHHFRNIPLSLAQTGTIAQIASYFNSSTAAVVNETDYQYNANYLARGISSLPVESRVLDSAGNLLSKTQSVYDESTYLVADSSTLSGNLAGTWVDPATDQTIPVNSRTLFGKPTTSKLWDNDNHVWIQKHTQYDQYGNVRKIWEPNEAQGSDRYAETQYSSDYGFAYPTHVITPAPDPTNMHGTSSSSNTSATYDFVTGLPLTATNDFGQTTATEYNDPLLRPTKVYGIGDFVIPISETIYDDDARTMKVRKQIDANNWDEATTFMDSLGRTYKTQAKDSQGDVFVETKYDFLGKVTEVTNPYRQGDALLWSKTSYDAIGRPVETFAPAPSGQTGSSLGTTQYDISTASGFIGTVITTTDAAGKKGRSITNALGQLIRVDEPDYTGGLAPLPQATPNPSPSPGPTPIEPPPGCSQNCLTNTEYPSYSTIYRYNALGKMIEVVQGNQKRNFLYDGLGRLLRVRQPEQEINGALEITDSTTGNKDWTAGFTYDLLGNVLTATDANGVTIHNEYDRASRVTRRYYTGEPAGQTTPEVSFFYDGKGLDTQQSPNFAKGKLTKVTSTVSETRYKVFDNFGRLKEMEQRTPVGTETVASAVPRVSKYTYNFSGALIEEEYPSGRKVKNEFESDGDLARIYGTVNAAAPERTYANSFTYTPDGKIESLRLGNLLWEKAKFNNRLQVTELALGHGVNQGDVWKHGYEYGELESDGTVSTAKNTGNIARQTLSFNGLAQPLVQSYKYDSLYRLKEARETAGTGGSAPQTWKETFDYDRYGNRTAHDKFFGTTQSLESNITDPTINQNTNRFDTGQNYGYDKNGNLISDPQNRAFSFDGDNKQSKVFQNGNLISEYFYDGEGKRVKKKLYDPGNSNIVTEETIFIYSAGKLIAEYSTAPPPEHPTTSYTATDLLGSPRVITNSVGEVVSRRDFMPFGEQAPNDASYRTTSLYAVGDNIRQKFTGYQKDDETQLDFAEARMYENRHGRFTAVDPLLASGKSASPQTFNRYVYVLNNPLVLTDPHGLQAGWSKYESKVKIDGQEVPWINFHYFTGNAQKDTYNAINGTNFQKFEGMYYLYGPLSGDHVFATLSSSGTYYEQEYKGSELIWNWALNAQNNGDNKAVDNLMFSGVLSGVTEPVFSENDNVAVRDIDIRLGIIPVFASPNSGIMNSGGRFATLNAARAEGEVAHHIPQNAFMRNLGSSRSDGPALGMTIEDHELTRTYAGRGAGTMRSDIGLNARERMFKDIISIRRTFGSRYNEGIREMLRYSRTLPEFQQKSPFRFFSRPRFTSGQGN